MTGGSFVRRRLLMPRTDVTRPMMAQVRPTHRHKGDTSTQRRHISFLSSAAIYRGTMPVSFCISLSPVLQSLLLLSLPCCLFVSGWMPLVSLSVSLVAVGVSLGS